MQSRCGNYIDESIEYRTLFTVATSQFLFSPNVHLIFINSTRSSIEIIIGFKYIKKKNYLRNCNDKGLEVFRIKNFL